MVAFLEKSHLLEEKQIRIMKENMLNGQSLAKILDDLGYPDRIVTQISFAEIHGNTEDSLAKIKDYLENLSQLKKRAVEVLTYPLILLSFLLAMLFGLRQYLLPQIEGKNNLSTFLSYFPFLFFMAAFFIFLIVLGLSFRWRKYPQKPQVCQYSKLPFLGNFVKLYMTAYYAREWGNLISQGLELTTILAIMEKEKSALVREIGQDMQESLVEGSSFYQKVEEYPFFTRELSLMIEYGDLKSKLGKELSIYAQLSWENFFSRMHKATQLIQPLIFLAVAIIILLLYAAMLMPIYDNMGGKI